MYLDSRVSRLSSFYVWHERYAYFCREEDSLTCRTLRSRRRCLGEPYAPRNAEWYRSCGKAQLGQPWQDVKFPAVMETDFVLESLPGYFDVSAEILEACLQRTAGLAPPYSVVPGKARNEWPRMTCCDRVSGGRTGGVFYKSG